MKNFATYATKELIKRIIESGADPIKADGLMVTVKAIGPKRVMLGFDVVDENGKPLCELTVDHLFSEGETLRIMDLDALFMVTVSP
jgi:hypothetical protein